MKVICQINRGNRVTLKINDPSNTPTPINAPSLAIMAKIFPWSSWSYSRGGLPQGLLLMMVFPVIPEGCHICQDLRILSSCLGQGLVLRKSIVCLLQRRTCLTSIIWPLRLSRRSCQIWHINSPSFYRPRYWWGWSVGCCFVRSTL